MIDLKNATAEALTDLVNVVKDSKGFVLKHAPGVAKEIVVFGRVMAVIDYALVVIILTQACFAIPLADTFAWGDEGVGAHVIMIVRLIGLTTIIPLFCIGDLLKPFVTPKLYILSTLAKMAKSETDNMNN